MMMCPCQVAILNKLGDFAVVLGLWILFTVNILMFIVGFVYIAARNLCGIVIHR